MYQQRPPFPPPPPRPPKTWWQRNRFGTLLIGGIVLIIVVGGVTAYTLAHRISKTMSETMDRQFEATENDEAISNEDNYENLLALCSADSMHYSGISARIRELKQSTDALAADIKALRQAYKDTLEKTDPGVFSSMDVTTAFFIRSGKARRLRKSIEAYSERAATLCNQSIDVFEEENYYDLPVKTTRVEHGLKSWESQTFLTQPTVIRGNFSGILRELREFETNRLSAFQEIIKTMQREAEMRDSLRNE